MFTVRKRLMAALGLGLLLSVPALGHADEADRQALRAESLVSVTSAQVCLVDTGVDRTNVDLAGVPMQAWSIVPGRDGSDTRGHGTGMAAVYAGGGGLIPGAQLLSVEADGGSTQALATGIRSCLSHGAKTINLSWGDVTAVHPDVQAALSEAAAADALVFVAAGNTHGGPVSLLAQQRPSIVVGSSTHDGAWDPDSARGAGIDVLAPGEHCGTSCATMLASSVAAGLRALAPAASAAQIRDAMLRGARPVSAGNMIDAASALNLLGVAAPSQKAAPTQAATASATTSSVRTPEVTSSVPQKQAQTSVTKARATVKVTLTARSLRGRVRVTGRGLQTGQRLVVRVGRDTYTGSRTSVQVRGARKLRQVRVEVRQGSRVIMRRTVTVR